jgi:hypothetical protein
MLLIWLQDFRSPFYIGPRVRRRGEPHLDPCAFFPHPLPNSNSGPARKWEHMRGYDFDDELNLTFARFVVTSENKFNAMRHDICSPVRGAQFARTASSVQAGVENWRCVADVRRRSSDWGVSELVRPVIWGAHSPPSVLFCAPAENIRAREGRGKGRGGFRIFRMVLLYFYRLMPHKRTDSRRAFFTVLAVRGMMH